MKDLVTEIKSTLSGISYPVQIKSIRSAYSKLAPVYPMIVVQEVNNTTRTALLGNERLSNLTYQIEVFSKDMALNLTPTAGSEIVRAIGTLIDAELNSEYGLTRTVCMVSPDINDATVSRLTLRYTGILDVTTDYMYR